MPGRRCDESEEAQKVPDDCGNQEYGVIFLHIRFAVAFQERLHDADACVIDDEQHNNRKGELQYRMDVADQSGCRQCQVV